MEVKPGYKQTEVGVIPEEWEVKLLPDVCRFRSGKAHEQFISETGRFVCVNSKFISTDGAVRKFSSANFCPAKKGDVLMVMSDLPNGRALAKAYLVEANDLYAVNQRVCALTAYRDCPEYLFYVLNRSPYFLKFDDGVNQTHLLNHVFQKCPLPVPPNVAEQRAIAEALSDVDGLLGGLDRLIAKKRDLKQAAMQQLLTGQTRLPGFHGEWEVKRLGEIARIQRGASPRPIDSPVWFNDNSSIGWVRISDVTKSGMFLRETTQRLSPLGVQHSRPVARGSLIMSICATVGRPIITEIDVCIHDGFVVFDDLQAVQLFTYYVLKWIEPDWGKHGQTGSQMNLNTGLITGTRISLPPLPEQTAIAGVLSEMDGELAVLEQRQAKTRALKQGMMQELLTGRTRLV